MVGVFRPTRFKTVCSMRNIIIGLLTVTFISFIINIHVFWTSKIIEFTCYSYSYDENNRFAIISLILLDSMIPHLTITLMDSLIIRKLKAIKTANTTNTTMCLRAPNSTNPTNCRSKTKTTYQIIIINSLIFIILFLIIRTTDFYNFIQ